MSADFVSTHIQRGMHLLRLHRYREAEASFKDALSRDPDNDFVLHQLAFVIWQQDGREREAMEIIRQAVRVAPNESNHHALNAQITGNVVGIDAAMRSADEAIRLDPTSCFAWTGRAQLHLGARRLPAAEADARKALELDPYHDGAANILSHSLRLQGRTSENAEQVASMLARNPEDDDNHSAAGWNALQARRYDEAQKHFREALRLNPENEFARDGLIEAFRSRSHLYRLYLRWTLWMQGKSDKMQLLVIAGLFVIAQFSHVIFSGPLAPFAGVFVAAYFIFVMWLHLAKGFGNFMLLCDRFARVALRRMEKWDATVTGGCVVGAVTIGALGAVLTNIPLIMVGATLLLAAIPFAYTFVNKSVAGRWFFGAAGAFILIAGGILVTNEFVDLHLTETTFSALVRSAVLTSVLSTWLTNVPALRR